ncbi:hypothetical protein EC973_007119 [Apophysomyces ossiformis]|uniref:tRNA A64-2'-O-ribosylphosphate transferase n=1 Tax=Apophysomyces ossiformis TaxID=679940 RepID=A0A8H7BVQ4_9FUNG|nr:hypothetical protein EC973_007119 [Apophysomyces ossiformis]
MYHSDLNQLRKDQKNIYNRLKSIEEDAEFVNEVSAVFPKFALVANERCGSWYIDPTERQVFSAYFKSTDGHMGLWDFNIRRNNLHLMDIIAAHGGCIIVDSTRKGKRMPDALSKTVPIWCATINRAVHKYRLSKNRSNPDWDVEFHSLPSDAGVDMERLDQLLKKPLRPLWFTPQSSLWLTEPSYEDSPFWPVICLSASQVVESACEARPGYLYVQGSADDQEAWCLGLTHKLFWKHRKALLSSGPNECEKAVRQIVRHAKDSGHMEEEEQDTGTQKSNYISQTTLAVGSRSSGKPPDCWRDFDVIVNCTMLEYEENKKHKDCYLQLAIPEGKKGQQALFNSIPVALDFVKKPLSENKRVLIHCAKGQDRSVGIALAILVKYYDLDEQQEPFHGFDQYEDDEDWVEIVPPGTTPLSAAISLASEKPVEPRLSRQERRFRARLAEKQQKKQARMNSPGAYLQTVHQWIKRPPAKNRRLKPNQLRVLIQKDPESLQAKVAMSPYAAIMASPLRLCKFNRSVFPSKLLIRFGMGWHQKSNKVWVHPTTGKSLSQGHYVKLQRRVLEQFHSKGGYRSTFRGAAIYRDDMTEEVQKLVYQHALSLFLQLRYRDYPLLRAERPQWVCDKDVQGFQCILLLRGLPTEGSTTSLHNTITIGPTSKQHKMIPCYDVRELWNENEIAEICNQLNLPSQETIVLGIPKDVTTVDLAVALWRCREFQS